MIETLITAGYWIAFAGFFACVAGYFVFPKLIKLALTENPGEKDENI